MTELYLKFVVAANVIFLTAAFRNIYCTDLH